MAAEQEARRHKSRWRQLFDEEGDPYYLDTVTAETTWSQPPGVFDAKHAAEARFRKELAARTAADLALQV